jgi:hypothetical protein
MTSRKYGIDVSSKRVVPYFDSPSVHDPFQRKAPVHLLVTTHAKRLNLLDRLTIGVRRAGAIGGRRGGVGVVRVLSHSTDRREKIRLWFAHGDEVK